MYWLRFEGARAEDERPERVIAPRPRFSVLARCDPPTAGWSRAGAHRGGAADNVHLSLIKDNTLVAFARLSRVFIYLLS